MSASISELLMPQVVIDLISRLKGGRGVLGSWLGFQPTTYDPATVTLSGPNTLTATGAQASVRNVTYRIFDKVRIPMKARAPGTGPATTAANPMGQNTVSVARFHQKISLNYEFLGNLSPMIGPNSQVDAGGQNYIAQQITHLARQGNRMVEMMAAGMLRDSLYFIVSGDDWLPTFTAPVLPTVGFQVPFRIPAGNKDQLNMLGTGNIIGTSWANPAAPIFQNIMGIISAYAQLSEYTMTDVWVNSLMLANIMTNTELRNLAGSSNQPFATYDQLPETGMANGGLSNKYYIVFRGLPFLRFHTCDDVLALNTDVDPIYTSAPASANLAKLIPDNMAIFCTEPSGDWTKFYQGGEYVVEQEGMPATLRTGWYAWNQTHTQPSMIELIALLNGVPILYIPNVVAPATVIF